MTIADASLADWGKLLREHSVDGYRRSDAVRLTGKPETVSGHRCGGAERRGSGEVRLRFFKATGRAEGLMRDDGSGQWQRLVIQPQRWSDILRGTVAGGRVAVIKGTGPRTRVQAHLASRIWFGRTPGFFHPAIS